MKYGMKSYITRKTYETDREQIEQIMQAEVIWRAAKEGFRQTFNTTFRWEEAGEFGEPDPDMMLLFTTTEVVE